MEENIKNLYYLDEMIKDMYNERMIVWGTKYMQFLHDWYDELYKMVGHTDKQRRAHLIKSFGKEMINEFLTPQERDSFLENDL